MAIAAIGAGIDSLFGGKNVKKVGRGLGFSQSNAEKAAHQEGKDLWEQVRAAGSRRKDVTHQRNKLLHAMQAQAAQIREDEPRRKEMLMQREADISRRSLAEKMKDVDAGAQSRGLLFSGLAQKAKQDEGLANMERLGENQAQVAGASRGLLDRLDDAALEDQLERQNLDIRAQQASLGQMEMDTLEKMRQRAAKTKMLKELGGLAGSAVGTAAGGMGGSSGSASGGYGGGGASGGVAAGAGNALKGVSF